MAKERNGHPSEKKKIMINSKKLAVDRRYFNSKNNLHLIPANSFVDFVGWNFGDKKKSSLQSNKRLRIVIFTSLSAHMPRVNYISYFKYSA